MPGMHGPHELIAFLAAALLSVGGGLILVDAVLGRRAAIRGVTAGNAAQRAATPRPGAAMIGSRSTIGEVRRAETLIAVGLSAGAAAIHLAAAPAHLEALGDLGLGFYWAALFQAAFAVALLAHPRSRRLGGLGIGVNLALVGAWAWSRTVGLPMIPGESVGIADGTAVLMEVLVVVLLVARLRGLDARIVRHRPAGVVRSAATSGLVAAVGIILLSTTIAIAGTSAGHADEPGAGVHHGAAGLDAGQDHSTMTTP